MTTYFSSDQHFGHAAGRSFDRRPLGSIAELDQQLIDRWNSIVSLGIEVRFGTSVTSLVVRRPSRWPADGGWVRNAGCTVGIGKVRHLLYCRSARYVCHATVRGRLAM